MQLEILCNPHTTPVQWLCKVRYFPAEASKPEETNQMFIAQEITGTISLNLSSMLLLFKTVHTGNPPVLLRSAVYLSAQETDYERESTTKNAYYLKFLMCQEFLMQSKPNIKSDPLFPAPHPSSTITTTALQETQHLLLHALAITQNKQLEQNLAKCNQN